jgi:membrane fusion protein (multidrug efflux system)
MPATETQETQQQDQHQQQGSDKPQGKTPESAPSASDESPAKKTGRKVIIFAVVLLLIIGAGFWYWRSTFTEDTDDAQVDGDIYQISARIAGQVTKVYVQDNTKVEKGQLLLEIDPKDQQVALEQAKAGLASAQADYNQATVNVPITSVTSRTQLSTSGSDVVSAQAGIVQAQKQAAAAAARVEQAQANAIKAQKDVERYTPLVEKDVISRQQYDAAIAAARANTAAVLEAQQTLVSQESSITSAQQKLDQARANAAQAAKNGPEQVRAQQARAASMYAQIQTAQAKVDQAILNLSYTRVVAPSAGIINKKNVQEGAYIAGGQDLLTIVPLDGLWVTANFKETQLKGMHRCQEVELKVDALGGRKFSGKVSQIGGATGSRLSLFPPENATGNYVKVVQRIPVRIDFTNLKQENGDYALRPGFSVTPDVSIKGTGDNKNDQNCEAGLPEKQNQ